MILLAFKPRLHRKVALITGAASGIGEETARLFAANGASVVVADIEDELGRKVAASIGTDQASFHHCDVRDEKQLEELVSYTIEKHGRLDILFSNAGVMSSFSSILALDMSHFDNVMATNVRGNNSQKLSLKRISRMSEDKSRRLHGKVALITGAANGIGEETARLFAANGAFVVVADIDDELGMKVVASIGAGVASFRHCDVRDEKQVEETVNYTVEKHGRIDILFSNAGVMGSSASILALDMSNFDNVMTTNVRGVVATIKHAGRAMVEQNIRGSIICTASVAGTIAGLASLAYTSSKHALMGVVKSSCAELGAYGIRVNCVSPHGVATQMACQCLNLGESEIEELISSSVSLKGVTLKASHIAEAVMFLASDESSFVSGQNLVVDGGFSVIKSII